MRMCDADNLGLQLTESIWCLLCKNPMHNDHGCDGACDVDKTLANKINDEIVNVIKANIVDAVPVVRCKDCKHWIKDVAGCTEFVGRCEWANWMVGENGYCVYGEGERKDETTANEDA